MRCINIIIGDSSVIFSANIHSFSSRNNRQTRYLLITDQSIYILMPNRRLSIQRRISIVYVTGVSLSKTSEDIAVLHHASREGTVLKYHSHTFKFVYFAFNICVFFIFGIILEVIFVCFLVFHF